MRKEKLITLFLVLQVIFIQQPKNVFALQEKTHETINKDIAGRQISGFSLGNYLKNSLGLVSGIDDVLMGVDANRNYVKKEVYKWLGYGGEQEDRPGEIKDYLLRKPTRSVNHFHNPLRIAQQWDNAGLNEFNGLFVGQSSVLWAQNAQQGIGGQWSWQNARTYFYAALTSKDEMNRQAAFADTFRAVGQLMHLIQDASVPEHSRNDAHALPAYEYYVEFIRDKHSTTWANWTAQPSVVDKQIFELPSASLAQVPVARLVDTDSYTADNPDVTLSPLIGIAEYANANFLSWDTLFTDNFDPNDRHYAPYPRAVDAVLWVDPLNQRKYLRKSVNGEIVDHLAATSILYTDRFKYFPQDKQYLPIGLDESCYAEYASNLIPRAVGYSAALLNYFFRGTIDITLPDRGAYAVSGTVSPKFDEIRLLARNTTEFGDEMTDGSIELVVRYRIPNGDPFQPVALTVSDYLYKIYPEKTAQRSIPTNEPIELTFDMSLDPLPINAVDSALQLVYHGRLGREDGAVAAGYRHISDPTPVDVFNNTDKTCINGTWYASGTPEAISQVDVNHDGIAYGSNEADVYPHELLNVAVKLSSPDMPVLASQQSNDALIASLPPGQSVRMLYFLTDEPQSAGDYRFNYSINDEWRATDPQDFWASLNQPGLYSGTAVKYQEEQLICGDAPCRVRLAPSYYPFRGTAMWWGSGLIVVNTPYPANTNCPLNALP